MRITLAVATVVAASLAACGGKILEDPNAAGSSSDGTSGAGSVGFDTPPAATTQKDPPRGPAAPIGKGSVEDPCASVCERNGKCGAWQTDCYERCAEDMSAPLPCSAEANAFTRCYADHLEGCSQVPPICEAAYCSFQRCQGKRGPSYCH